MAYTGFYNDGHSARRHPVEVFLLGASLRFSSPDRQIEQHWRGDGLRLLEEAYAGKPLRLTHCDHADAVLSLDDPDLQRKLIEACPHLGRKVIRGTKRQRVVAWSVISIAFVAALLVGLPHLAASMAPHTPSEWADSLGETVVDSVIDGGDVCAEVDGITALRNLVGELAASSNYEGTITLRVIDDSRINAFAAPGGQIVIFRGLIDAAGSGAQVAGVLAHELAHVVQYHPMKGVAREIALRFAITMLIGDVSQLTAIAAKVGGQLISSTYSRSTEAEADAVAVALLNEANYGAAGIAEFFELLDERNVGELPDMLTWLASHPVHAKRSAAVRAVDRGGRQALRAEQWDAVRSVCPDIVGEGD